MRSPLFWMLGWLGLSFLVYNLWPDMTNWLSGFWFGWSTCILGQDIADWLKAKSKIKESDGSSA